MGVRSTNVADMAPDPCGRPAGRTVARPHHNVTTSVDRTRMRSILDTRPKGAPGRDKPVPYGGVQRPTGMVGSREAFFSSSSSR